MLNEEFLNGVLGNEGVSAEDKVRQIIAEHEADTRGLIKKRDELLGSEKKLKEQVSAYETKSGEYESKIAELSGMLEKANGGDKKAEEYYNAQLADLKKRYDGQIETLTSEKNKYEKLHYNSLREKAIEDGTKDLQFVPGLKQGFIARVLSMNDFEPQEINGELKFLNREHHTIEEAINSFALTQEGKAYIANPSTGGGARGSSGTPGFLGGGQISPQQLDTMSDAQIMEFAMKGGQVAV